jgi:hypothetical protein
MRSEAQRSSWRVSVSPTLARCALQRRWMPPKQHSHREKSQSQCSLLKLNFELRGHRMSNTRQLLQSSEGSSLSPEWPGRSPPQKIDIALEPDAAREDACAPVVPIGAHCVSIKMLSRPHSRHRRESKLGYKPLGRRERGFQSIRQPVAHSNAARPGLNQLKGERERVVESMPPWHVVFRQRVQELVVLTWQMARAQV